VLFAFAKVAGHHVIAWLVIGAIAGALAGKVMRGAGFGLVRDTLVGLVGAVLGGLALHAVRGTHASTSFVVEVLVAFVGAVVLVAIVRAVSPRERRTLSR
jgi:uncharacterized membrane protein YeaQ/YmgE (transglycosylase-associated protein family)